MMGVAPKDPSMLPTVEKVLFIGGSGRSGTTVVREALSLHPDIYAIHHESHPEAYDATRYSHWKRTVWREAVEKANGWKAKVIVEKTPSNCFYFPELLRNPPGGVEPFYLHVGRNLDATVNSLVRHTRWPLWYTKTAPRSKMAAHYYAQWISWMVADEVQVLADEGHNVAGIKIEDLSRDPRHWFFWLCRWLGIGPPTKGMIQYGWDPERAAGRKPAADKATEAQAREAR